MDVLLTLDRAFLIGAAVTMRTISENADPSRQLRFHILHPDLTDEDIERLRSSVAPRLSATSVTATRLDLALFKGFLRSKSISLTAYARLLAGDVLPSTISRAVYVDVDVLFYPDISELFDLDLQGKAVAGVPNGSTEDQVANAKRIGTDASSYVATGLLIIDLDRWRNERLGERALSFAGSSKHLLTLHDQDALNWVLRGDFFALSEKWCHWSSHPPVAEARVIHYAMSRKPWHADYRGGYREDFFAVLDRTSFAGWRPKNLLGLAPLIASARRRIPYAPTVVRMVLKLFRRD